MKYLGEKTTPDPSTLSVGLARLPIVLDEADLVTVTIVITPELRIPHR